MEGFATLVGLSAAIWIAALDWAVDAQRGDGAGPGSVAGSPPASGPGDDGHPPPGPVGVRMEVVVDGLDHCAVSRVYRGDRYVPLIEGTSETLPNRPEPGSIVDGLVSLDIHRVRNVTISTAKEKPLPVNAHSEQE